MSPGTDKVDKKATKRGSVAIVGVGALGTAAALELAGSAVRALRLIDGDRVELSNLHRQMLHETTDIGRLKAAVAAEKLASFGVSLDVRGERLFTDNAGSLLAGCDVVVDATDDAATKYLLNDLCVGSRTPLVHAGVAGFQGQLLAIVPGEGPCLRCLFPEPPAEDESATCRDGGVLGPLAATIGALEARLALEMLDGEARPRLIRFDARTLTLRTTFPRRSANCFVCTPGSTRAALPTEAVHPKELT